VMGGAYSKNKESASLIRYRASRPPRVPCSRRRAPVGRPVGPFREEPDGAVISEAPLLPV
jgi:hypothetical protein